MQIAERHRYILDALKSKGVVSVAALSEAMEVTTVTVRKDLRMLEQQGVLQRSHGGASLPYTYVNDRPIDEKMEIRVEEKQRIANRTVELLSPEEAVIIGSGTTVRAFAQAIPRTMKLTVLTGAMNVSLALLGHPEVELVQLGGVVRKSSASVIGHYSERMLADFACTKLFLSVDGISPDFGLTTSNMMEAHLNAQMIKAVPQAIILADSSKFEKKGFGKICDVTDIHTVITDEGLPKQTRQLLEDKGIRVMIA
ncbi:MAG: DeoR/GlpR transcriptional regulator [Phaeodactylibacter sp.]|nr:DeoR/GlpR transcriptional regulator [Phaeodactylibacter sp.]